MDDEHQELEERTVALAALIRGVEESLRKGRSETPAGARSLVSSWRDDFNRCVDGDLLELLTQPDATARAKALDDSRVIALAELLHCADRLASAEAAPRHRNHLKGSGLAPVSDRIELLKPHQPQPRGFRFHALTDAHSDAELPFFAVDGYQPTPKELADHITSFREQLERILKLLDWSKFECVYAHLLSLLQAYGWCLPSGMEVVADDVSLYDQLRVTSAIAACLYKFHDAHGTLREEEISAPDQTRCVLLTGDVSGIQNYIFDVSTTGAGGVAKRLRARSFFVQLLSDAASLRVLRRFKLPLANLLMASGGNFNVLLPRLYDTDALLNDLQREFDQRLLERYHGLLAINLAWTDIPDDDFAAGRYSVALLRLHAALQLRKARRLKEALQEGNHWRKEFVRERFEGSDVCASCRRFAAAKFSSIDRPRDEGPDICEQCADQEELGRQLTKARYLAFYEGDEGGIDCLGLSASVDNTIRGLAEKARGEQPFLIVSLNDPALSDAARFPATFRYIANHVPRDTHGAPRSFEEIADNGLLGVLKADVDRLGLLFQEGLSRDLPATGFDTVSRIAALSRQLDWFFSGWVEWLLSKEYDDCYTVYSGGDDLLIVGPRARALKLARMIRDEFSRYANHPEITISAGISIVKQRLPLAHTVKQAGDALHEPKQAGRNCLSVLGRVLAWDELATFDRIVALLDRSKPHSAFLYHLFRAGEMYRKFADPATRDVRLLRFIAVLAETLARNVDSQEQAELFDWGCDLLDVRFRDGQIIKSDLDQLALAAQWTILGRRES